MFPDDKIVANTENVNVNVLEDSGRESPLLSPNTKIITAIEGIPSTAFTWRLYVNDLMETKRKRKDRVARDSETLPEFLERFPLSDDQNLPNPENDYANIVPDSIGMESPPWTPVSNNINTIENLPCSALSWKIYLEDLMKAKKERQKRIERESEKVSEFLKRFPLVDDFTL